MHKDNQQIGPITKENLLKMGLTSDTLVWTQGMSDWKPAALVEDLAPLFIQNTATPPPITPQQPSQQTIEQPKEVIYEQQQPKKKNYIKYIVIAAILLIMVFTCPDKEKHQQAITNKVTSSLVTDSSSEGMGLKMLGALIAPAISQMMLEGMMNVHNYGLISVGTIDSKPVSIGAFGNVFILNSDKLDAKKYLEEYKDKLLNDTKSLFE